MSLDRSFKGKSRLTRHRNVLTRAERIDRLKDLGKWEDGTKPTGLPKVSHRKVTVGKKEKAVKTDDAEKTEDVAKTESK